MSSAADDGPPARDPDYYRKGGVRLLGYANECGEAFRPLIPQAAVSATYAVAFTYVAADASWRARTLPSSSRLGALAEAADTLVWQTLASVAIPGFTINRIVWASQRITTPPSRSTTASTFSWSACTARCCDRIERERRPRDFSVFG